MNDVKQIILIDDEDEVRLSVAQTLELKGFTVTAFAEPEKALNHITANFAGIVVTDLKMPRMDGLAVLNYSMGLDVDLPVVIITAHGDIPAAVQAMRDGAYDFVEKNEKPERLVDIARRALEKRALVLENRNLRHALESSSELDCRIIGQTQCIENLRKLTLDLANMDVDVLLVGETGTGKEVAARCLHDFGGRRKKPFVALSCGALAESVIESELFGHEAGAFTGAHKRRIGKIEYAEGGTLFLDEIESMPQSVQVRLLRVLQERTLERVGGNDPVAVDVRIVAASKIDLRAAADEGSFREDLLYRLQVAQIYLPPLRDRIEDAPLLFRHFTQLAAKRYRRPVPEISMEKVDELVAQLWPGNVRELRNSADRFVLGLNDPDSPSKVEYNEDNSSNALSSRLACFERTTITVALQDHEGRIGETALALGLPRKTLYLRMQKYGLDRDDFV